MLALQRCWNLCVPTNDSGSQLRFIVIATLWRLFLLLDINVNIKRDQQQAYTTSEICRRFKLIFSVNNDSVIYETLKTCIMHQTNIIGTCSFAMITSYTLTVLLVILDIARRTLKALGHAISK